MRPSRPARPTAGDILFETFVAAGSGGAVVAFFFLVLDLLAGQPLATPSLAGQVIFSGADPAQVSGVDVTAVANMTALHLVAFAAIGMVASFAVRAVRSAGHSSFVASAAVVLAVIELPALLASGVIFPGLGSAIGQGSILVANILAAPVMTAALLKALGTATRAEPVDRSSETAAPV